MEIHRQVTNKQQNYRMLDFIQLYTKMIARPLGSLTTIKFFTFFYFTTGSNLITIR